MYAPKLIEIPHDGRDQSHPSFPEPKRDRVGDGDSPPFETFPEIETVAVRLQLATWRDLETLVRRNRQESVLAGI